MKANCLKQCNYLFSILAILLFLSNFTFSQTTWYKYPGNPIFYRGEVGEWDHILAQASIIFDNNKYHMWYVGYEKNMTGYGDIGYATSDDLIHWEKFEANPLKFKCEGTPWDTAFLGVEVLKTDTMYYMWYTGERKDKLMYCYIGSAWSKNGIDWIKHPEPVLMPGKDDDWDALTVGWPTVLFDGEKYHIWYVGDVNNIPIVKRTGYATSDDGIQWIKHPDNPVLDIGESNAWDDQWVSVNAVNFNGATYEMWYTGFNGTLHQIGYASSKYGINWTKYSGNPVLKIGELGEWDASYIGATGVLSWDSVYYMIYGGNDRIAGNQFGYATTSIEEAKEWNNAGIGVSEREIKLQVLNRVVTIKVDSLINILQELKGTELIDAYNKLALAYSLNNEEKSFSYAEKALGLAKKEHYPAGKAMALYTKGNCLYVMDKYGDALANQLIALQIFDSLGMHYEVGSLLLQIASIHSYASSYELATNYFNKSLEVFEKLHDTASILYTMDYLGYAYLQSGDTTSSINVFQKCLSLAKEYQDISTLAYAYRSLGDSYKGKILDSSIYYLNESQKIWDSTHWIETGHNYQITAEAYYSFGPNYYKKAEEYYLKAKEVYKFEGRERKVIYTYGLAELYLVTGRYDRVDEELDKLLKRCQSFLAKLNHQMHSSLNQKLEHEIYLKTYLEKAYQLYFRLDTTLNDDEKAWKHLALATQWKDSIYNQQKQRQWAMMQGQYETESAQRHIDGLENENEVKELRIKQSRIYFFALIGFILILVFVGLLFFRQRKIKTLVREQKLQHDLEINKIESEKLKELDHLKSRFFANISHEFRTPLTLIMGPLEKLLSKTKDDKDKKELNTANKYAIKLQKLINNLLTISKLESGKMQLHASETDIVKLLRTYIQAFESLANQKNIALNFTTEKKEIKAFIDREKFEQVLNNLLSNAFKFTGEGGEIKIAVSKKNTKPKANSQEPTANSSQWAELKISDTGRGILPEYIDHIFDRFYQVAQEDNSYYEGTGIGLALTKELVELHYGTIKVESEPEKGSTFTLLLPLGKEHLKKEELVEDDETTDFDIHSDLSQINLPEQEISIQPPESSNQNPEKQPILLIVEDNTDMRNYIREYFENEYHIIEAVDGLDGYEKSIEHIPDIIISDVMMPKMDGNEFCTKVKSDERTSHIPFILLTARASSEYKIEGLETGADDYISKPFDQKELQVRVKNLVKQRQKLREKFVADFWKGDQSPTLQMPVSDLSTMDKKFLQKALDIVNKHLSDPEFDVNHFSREMAMSRQQIHRKIRALVDQSATEFIRVIRLKRAAELLSKKSGTVSEIAYDVGFSSLSYFTRSFQQQFGTSPSEYIEKHNTN